MFQFYLGRMVLQMFLNIKNPWSLKEHVIHPSCMCQARIPNLLGAVVVMIVWYLDWQPHMQSVPITTKVVSSNPAYGEVYYIQH